MNINFLLTWKNYILHRYYKHCHSQWSMTEKILLSAVCRIKSCESFFREMWSWKLEGCRFPCKNSIISLPQMWCNTSLEYCNTGTRGGKYKVLWALKEFPVPANMSSVSLISLRMSLPGKWLRNFKNTFSNNGLRNLEVLRTEEENDAQA